MNSVRQFVSGCASSLLAGLLASLAYFRGFRFFSKILFHGEPVLRSYVARKKKTGRGSCCSRPYGFAAGHTYSWHGAGTSPRTFGHVHPSRPVSCLNFVRAAFSKTCFRRSVKALVKALACSISTWQKLDIQEKHEFSVLQERSVKFDESCKILTIDRCFKWTLDTCTIWTYDVSILQPDCVSSRWFWKFARNVLWTSDTCWIWPRYSEERATGGCKWSLSGFDPIV